MSLVIQDGDSVYVTFLRDLSKTIDGTINNEQRRIEILKTLFDKDEYKIKGSIEERKAARIRVAEVYNDAKTEIFFKYHRDRSILELSSENSKKVINEV